ncbi:uncharacterized protein [Littorina saxatilis]|uniref:uncharacterized protein n=1 Tax=Littorina saxatilis TaxID=31220 RepID=UPI0038B4785F
MEKTPFGVNLKRTGADPVRDKGFSASASSVTTSRTARKISSSIHTPLKPANVNDLKAMFDDKKGGSGAGTASSSGASSPRSGAVSPRSGTTSPRSGSSSPGHAGLSAKKTESSVLSSTRISSATSTSGGVKSSVLDTKLTSKTSSGLDRTKVTTNTPKSGTTFSSSVGSASSVSSSRDNAFPSRININIKSSSTSSSSSKIGDRPSSAGRSWSPKGAAGDSKPVGQGLRNTGWKSVEKKEESRVEIPVHHVVTTKKSTGSAFDKKNKFEQLSSAASQSNKPLGKGSTAAVTTTVKTTEKKSGLFSSSLTSNKPSKDQNNSTKSSGGTGGIIREIPVQRIPSDSKKTGKGDIKPSSSEAAGKQFTRGNNLQSSFEKKKFDSKAKPENAEVAASKVLGARKLSNERFERLKFDFERGVPTESQERRNSDNADHLELQLKVRDLRKVKVETKTSAEEERLKKEESIFDKGMKVSDFVKHINTVHPPSGEDEKPVRKFQAGGPKSASQKSSEPEQGGENEYIEMPEEGAEDGIYESMGDEKGGEKDKDSGPKAPERRHGVYRKERGKQGSDKKKKDIHTSVKVIKANGGDDLNDSVEIVISSGEDAESSTDSSGTDYEPVEGDNLYEDPDTLDALNGKKKKLEEKVDSSKSLGNKLKKNYGKATNYLNKKFNQKKKSKEGSVNISGTGTDSDGDMLEDDDAASDISPLSRTSSERSSGRLSRPKNKELTVEIPKMQQGEEEERLVGTPPPPLPPRASKVLKEMPVENSPPLPPRNPNLGVNLDMVIPITPPIRGLSPGDLKRKSDRFSFGRDSDSGDVPDYELAKTDSYLDFDPASPKAMDKMERKDKTTSSQGSRTSTGSYLYPDNISDWPQLTGDSEDEELYIELADDQIYGRQDRTYSTKFESEPLYQWYAKDKIIRTNRQVSTSDISGSDDAESSTDDSVAEERDRDQIYEDVERLLQRSSTRRGPDAFQRNAPARRSVIMDVFGKSGSLHRALWCEMPEVKKSGVLTTMDPQDRKVQESMFEIMTSEASYLRSLNVLINVFLKSPEFGHDHEMSDRCVITKRERQFLFSNIGCIRDISAKFLADLEARWQESCIMNDICDIIAKHAQKNFEPYIRYCSNQAFQERALESLQKKPEFMEAVKRLEHHPDCQFLPMSSFLLLPMQRITRLPLLVDAVRHRLDPGTKRHTSATTALDHLNHVVKQCNEGAKKMLQTEQMCLLAANIEFNKVKEFPLVSSSRYLVKQGELNRIVTEGTSRIPFGRKSKEHVYLYLFSDILLITKKRGNVYQVRDYCQRNALHTELIDNPEKSKFMPQGGAGVKNIFLLALLHNHEGKQVELVLSAKSESERTRWIDAILPHHSNPEYERIYEEWDCPQVQCVEKYIATEPDELTLEESDVVNVFKKMADGWYEGERIRDCERGWFPADHTEEINNSHVRARNLRLRYRLMIASQEYTDMTFTGGN